MQKIGCKTKCKLGAKISLLLLAVLIFFPTSGNAQQVDISVSAEVMGPGAPPPPPTPPPPPRGGGVVIIVLPANVIFKGRAYPFAILTILKNGTVIATFKAESSGLFQREIKGIAGGTYNFSIFAEDTEGRKSVTIGFTLSILAERTTTISGIFISPTIDLGPTRVEKGQDVNIFGQAFPESQVNIFISSKEIVKEATTTKEGKWIYKLNTSPLEEKEHEAKAKALYGAGEQSSFSQTVSFLVLKKGALVCRGADLNFDSRVNLIDFSILLYYWHQKKPANICVDINQDGIVDLVDFSIMMYYWTR